MIVALIGGSGPLGQLVDAELAYRDVDTRIVSRNASGPHAHRADIVSGAGLSPAIEGTDTVILLASDYTRPIEVDVGGATQVLEHIGDRHLIYISIVGVDRHPLPYYKAKHQVEQMIEGTAPRFSILRATQFHGFIASTVSGMVHGPVCVVPLGYVYQPVDIGEVATYLADITLAGPGGMLPDLAGPEVLDVAALARTHMEAVGKERPILPMPRLGAVAAAFRQGLHTNPERAVGKKTWARWLAENYD